MSRWIDADALIESICHTADLGGWIGDTLRNIKRLAVRYISSTPSIDIVRCRECKHWNVVSNGCMRNPSVEGWQADDFCSYGMRNADSNTLNTLDALDDNSSEKPNNSERSSE